MITSQISLHSNNRGRGFWKLNTSFLNDIEYVNRIKSITKQTKVEYAQDDTVNPNLLWEMVKLKEREESLKYGTSKKYNKQSQLLKNVFLNLMATKLDENKCGRTLKQRNANWRQ